MRIQFLDALRGIAAMAVVLHHYNERLDWEHLSFGYLGVPVFFVLSSFVIAMSIGEKTLSAPFIGKFALRRAVRLDPPCWLTIACVVGIGYLLQRHLSFDGVTAAQVVAHMFYLQDALAYDAILPISRTLCYEIQFYLALAPLMWAMQESSAKPYLLVAVLLVLSLLDRHFEFTHHAFMGRFWFCFALGAITYWTYAGKVHLGLLTAMCLLVGCVGVVFGDGYALTASITTAAISIALLSRRPHLLVGSGWQFLGRLSYSLYLTHLLFRWLALRVSEHFLPVPLAALVGIAVALVSAWAFYYLIEKPSINLSRRLAL